MNFLSNQIPSYRIFVGDFDQQKQQYNRARIERVAFPPYGFPKRIAWDDRMRCEVEIYLFAMDFNSFEVVPLFLVPNKLISSCLFHIKVTIDQFESY